MKNPFTIPLIIFTPIFYLLFVLSLEPKFSFKFLSPPYRFTIFFTRLSKSDVSYCKMMAGREINQFSAKQTFNDCKNERKSYLKEEKQSNFLCKKKEDRFNRLTSFHYAGKKSGSFWFPDKYIIENIERNYGKYDKWGKKWFEYPMKDLGKLSKDQKHIYKIGNKLTAFRKCSFYDIGL